uniref:Uncharacterized protein n=1 Tax=Ditylenchus dipsaci TaxID=166011 RepID=A0A915CS22_9BILA
MWGEENSNSAETVTINPWAAGLSQPQSWQGPAAMGRGSNQPVGGVPAGAGAYRAGVGSHQQQRQWDPQQQQLQNNPAGTWAPTGQMTWNQMPPGGGQPASTWHISQQQQQWNPASNSPSGTYADQAKKNMPLPRNGGPPSLAAAAAAAGNGPPRLFPDGQQPLGSSNWGGTVKVDQQTPWDTTGNAPPPPQQHAGDWNSGNAGGAGRWGQPIAGNVQMAPPGAATGWQPTGHPNSLVNAPPVTGGADWSAQSPAVLAHRINPAAQHHDTTGTAHWNAGAPPPVAPTSLMMVSAGSVPPPAPGSNWCQPGTGGPGGGGPPPAATDPANRLSYDPNPQTPGPWVAPQRLR